MWKLLLILSLLVSWGKSHASNSPPMSLKQVIQYGVENSPTMKVTRNTYETKKLERKSSLAAFFPSLDFTAVHGYQDGDPTSTTNPWASTLNLGLTENLYDNGTNMINYDVAQLEEDKAQLVFEKERNAFVLKVLEQYYNNSQSVELYNIQLYQHDILKTQFQSLEGKYRRGEKTRTEYLRFKAQLQRSQLDLVKSQKAIENSLSDLKALIGFVGNEFQVATINPMSDQKANLKPVEKFEIKGHFDSKIVKKEKLINQLNSRLVERKYYPQVFLTAGISYSNSDYLGGSDDFEGAGQTSWNTLLTLKYNLWDWGTRRRDVSVARLARDSSNSALDIQLNSLESELAKLVVDLNQEKENYKLNQELVKLENDNYKSIEREYRNGQVAFLDLVSAVENLTKAKQSLIQNYFQLSQLLADYEYHQGTLYENIFRR